MKTLHFYHEILSITQNLDVAGDFFKKDFNVGDFQIKAATPDRLIRHPELGSFFYGAECIRIQSFVPSKFLEVFASACAELSLREKPDTLIQGKIAKVQNAVLSRLPKPLIVIQCAYVQQPEWAEHWQSVFDVCTDIRQFIGRISRSIEDRRTIILITEEPLGIHFVLNTQLIIKTQGGLRTVKNVFDRRSLPTFRS